MKIVGWSAVLMGIASSIASAQDQQLGARTKAMGGSYTAFEDDPLSVWLNPAGIATQPDSMSIVYQTYLAYPVDQARAPGDTIELTVEPETILIDPAILPAYLGFVFQLGDSESPLAIGICFARPYHINYALDQVSDPFQTQFRPESNVDQTFLRFRTAIAKDFRLKPPGTAGWFNHIAVGGGLDISHERWQFSTQTSDTNDTATSMGFGLGLLVGVYDNANSFRINLGFAYQSPIHFDFSIEPDILPAFDMPEQINAGLTIYALPGALLRVTIDFQFIRWSETAEAPLIPNQNTFEDVVNSSIGFEYKISASKKVVLFPRMGFRRFDAPWGDADALPMTGSFRLVLDTKGESFTIFTAGIGISWTTETGKIRTVDLAFDVGGDTTNVAVGYNQEF